MRGSKNARVGLVFTTSNHTSESSLLLPKVFQISASLHRLVQFSVVMLHFSCFWGGGWGYLELVRVLMLAALHSLFLLLPILAATKGKC